MQAKTDGITLIALVVTIVVLIILATISINAVFGENGMIKRAEASKSLQELEEEKQRLELIKPEVLADNLGKMTVEQYVKALKDNNITVDEDITSNPDGSKTVITDTGYSVLIEQDGERNVIITIEGKAGNLPPRIVIMTAEREQDETSITVSVEAIRTKGATLKYYYKTSSRSYQTEPLVASSATGFTITGIDENETYTIKIELSNEYGTASKEITEKDRKIIIYKDGKLVEESITIDHENIRGEDKLGNKITLPGGFRTTEESGKTVEDGIVIEDSIGNQFVWVPVSNIDGDGVVENQNATGLITKKDGSKVQITLGRYTFATTSPGTPTLVQKGSEYANENTGNKYTINSSYTELTTFRESNYKQDKTGVNATAKNLQGFIESVRDNHGYYIARYEASYGSGSTVADYKPLSQKSIANSTSSMNYTKGTLWNFIRQGDASKVSRNMYEGNLYVESDLINSYMWDTTIVYLQAMGNENMSNTRNDAYNSLKNTGETGDEKCHIFDMASNTMEWTTEYYANTGDKTYPCAHRGCYYTGFLYAGSRYNREATNSNHVISFRVGLYVNSATR